MFNSLRPQDQVAVQQFPGGHSLVGVVTTATAEVIKVKCGDKTLQFNTKDGHQIDQEHPHRGFRLICRFNEED